MDDVHERALLAQGAGPVAGIDESGRGPLAGPVVAAAVIYEPGALPEGVADSKTLSPKRRELLAEALLSRCETGIGIATVEEIDRLNILRAAHLAMLRAAEALPRPVRHLLIDGNLVPRDCPLAATALVRGDGRAVSVAAASILAKVTRDAIMRDLAQHFPGYGWETNKGYPSKSHKSALRDLGPTPHHRRSFAPVRNILWQENSPSP